MKNDDFWPIRGMADLFLTTGAIQGLTDPERQSHANRRLFRLGLTEPIIRNVAFVAREAEYSHYRGETRATTGGRFEATL
jgi:hypothetical protein